MRDTAALWVNEWPLCRLSIGGGRHSFPRDGFIELTADLYGRVSDLHLALGMWT